MTPTLVCETVTADRMADLRRARDRARGRRSGRAAPRRRHRPRRAGGARRPDEARDRHLPARRGKAGATTASEQDRLRVLAEAIRLGAEFVDVEWRADWRQLPRGERTRLILSVHDFDGVPQDLARLVADMRAAGPAIVKAAVMARRLSDCITLARRHARPPRCDRDRHGTRRDKSHASVRSSSDRCGRTAEKRRRGRSRPTRSSTCIAFATRRRRRPSMR